ISRDSQKALAATLLVLLLVTGGGPAIDAIIARLKGAAFAPVLSLSSPIHLYTSADAWGATPFWSGLFFNQAVGWVLIGLTCHLIPRTWADRTNKNGSTGGRWAARWRFGSMKARVTNRQKFVSANPALWLACRE